MRRDHTQARLCFQQARVLALKQGHLYAWQTVAPKKKAGPSKPALTAFGRRVRDAMKLRGVDGEADLVKRIQALAPGDENEEFRRKSLTQQMVNHVLNGHAERSYFTPFIAAALEVSAIWLGWGIGPQIVSVTNENEEVNDAPVHRGRRASGMKS